MVQFSIMTLEEKIYQDYVAALKAKDKSRVDFLSFIRAELKNHAIDLKKKQLDDHEVLIVLKKQRKCLIDSKDSFSSSGRTDLLSALEKELALLDGYLPQPLANNELIQIIETVISQTQAFSLKDMGMVMKEVINQVGVRADSSKVSQIVKSKLSQT